MKHVADLHFYQINGFSRKDKIKMSKDKMQKSLYLPSNTQTYMFSYPFYFSWLYCLTLFSPHSVPLDCKWRQQPNIFTWSSHLILPSAAGHHSKCQKWRCLSGFRGVKEVKRFVSPISQHENDASQTSWGIPWSLQPEEEGRRICQTAYRHCELCYVYFMTPVEDFCHLSLFPVSKAPRRFSCLLVAL